MKILKALFILISLKLFLAIIGCCKEQFLYNINSLQITNLDNSGQYPDEAVGNEIAARAFGLRAKMDIEYYAQTSNYLFCASTMATSCAKYFKLKNTIVSLDIATLSKFDSLHNQNSDVTDYFVSRNSEDTTKNYVTVPSLISSINETEIGSAYSSHPEGSFDFYLLHEPTADSIFQFVINLHFNDGSTLSDTSQQVILR